MGLDITAARKITRLSGDYSGDGFYVGSQPDEFVSQADGLEPGTYEAAETLKFRAGSYGGYNKWREQLAKLAGYPAVRHESHYEPPEDLYAAGAWDAKEGPFWELINFSDCEGVIGPKTSAKLAKDFAEFQAQADAHPDDWFRDLYTTWRRAFELASDDGAVGFH